MDKQIMVSPPPQVPRPATAAGPTPAAGEPRTKTAADEAGPPRRRVRDRVRDRRSRPEPPRLVFSPLAWMKLMLLMQTGDTEVGCFGVSNATDPLYVEDLSVPKQYTSMVTVRFDDGSVADHFDRMADRGIGPARCSRVWVHTHPGGSATPSAIDEETFQRAFGDADWSVMAIAARGGDTYARLSFSAGPGGSVLLPVSVDWSKWPQILQDDESGESPLPPLFERWMDEYGQCVQPEPIRTRLTAGDSSVDESAAGPGAGARLLAADELDLLTYGGWDYLDLQEAYALQEMDEMERRREESWSEWEGGFHE